MATIKELLEGLAFDHIVTGLVEGSKDIIDKLSEDNIIYTDKESHFQGVGKDGNVLSTVDDYGDVAGNVQDSNLIDRTYTTHEWTFPNEREISITIPHQKLSAYGFDAGTLFNAVASNEDYKQVVQGINPKLKAEYDRLLEKVRTARRNDVIELLSNLQAPLHDWQKPLGLNPVDDAVNRPNNWNYTNLMSSANLDANEFSLAVNILASRQKTITNTFFGVSTAQMLLHADNFTLAESIFAPSIAVDANQRRAGATLGDAKYASVYQDPAHPNDWIVLGYFHKIKRLAFRTIGGKEVTNGIKVEIYRNANGSITLKAYERSIIICPEPTDIVKSVAP